MDRHFNHEVAGWITKSMSRMDPDEAEMFALFLVDEVYWADRENNARVVDRHVEEIHKSLYRDTSNPVAKRLIREVIFKGKKNKSLIDPDIPYDKKWGKPQPRKAGKFVKISAPGFRYEAQTLEPGSPVGSKPDADHLVYHGRNNPEASFDLSSALSSTGRNTKEFEERWNAQAGSSNQRTYNRISAGAKLTSSLAGGSHPGIAAVGAVGEFVGSYGPEAEKVIGPAARKTAYRYRGTERTPAAEVDNLHDEMLSRRLRGEGLSTKDITPELRANAAEIAAITYLGSKLPSQKLASLQLQSGKVPPSQGVMIDDKGEIVAEAVGYNEDHYLPFNLKNLKGLKGGSYVRTRSTGGLTTEDIYTGLLGGARSVTVVSRSGVFTLDFDDELRGGRRYSDKAHQMVGRYAHTLDAIKSEQVVREKLSPEERAEIRANVEDEMKGGDYNAKEIEDEIATREKDFVAGVRYSESEVAAVNEKAEQIADEYNGLQGQKFDQIVSHTGGQMLKGQDYRDMPKNRDARVRAIKSELMDQLRERKSKRKYVLDGEGYSAAMDALQEQYPYFIQHVEYKPYREVNGQMRTPSNERDTGYVMPNYNRPAAAKAGYFAEEIEGKEKGKGKSPANETNYQNWANRQQARNGPTGSAGSAEAEEEKTATGKTSTRHARSLQIRQAEARVRAQRMEGKAMADGMGHAKSLLSASSTARAKYSKLNNFDADRENPENMTTKERQEYKKQMKELRDTFNGLPDEDKAGLQDNIDGLTRALKAMDEIEDQMASDRMFDLKEWDPRRSYRVPPKIEDKEEYVEDAAPEVYKKAWNDLNRSTHGGSVPLFGYDASPEQLREYQEDQGKLAAAAEDLQKDDSDENRLAFQDAAIKVGDKGGLNRVLDELEEEEEDGTKKPSPTLKRIAEKARKQAERALRLRRIKHVAGDKLTEAPSEKKVAAGGENDPEPPKTPIGFGGPKDTRASDEPPRQMKLKTPAGMTVNMRIDNHPSLSGGDFKIGKSIVKALEADDDDAVLEHMDAMQASNPRLYSTLKIAIINADGAWADTFK